MTVDRPVVALVTASDRPGAAANNESRWLSAAFAEMGVRGDAIYLAGPTGVEWDRTVRRVHLGTTRARDSVFALARYLREADPAVTIAWPSHIGPFAVIAGVIAHRPVVPWEVALLSRDLGDGSRWPLNQRVVPSLQRLTYRFAPAVAANSRDVADDLSHRLRASRFVPLPNSVDVDGVRSAATAGAMSSHQGFRFCAVGHLSASKGYDVLLDALARADGRLPREWELLVIGDGPRRHELVDQAERLGLASRVSFLGHDPSPYLLMASADAFVHAARWEGFGIVLTEALALERPVVATACPGGPKEILDGGRYGLLVEPDDADALADALVRIGGDERLRAELSSRALEGARRYDARTIAQRMIELASVVEARRN